MSGSHVTVMGEDWDGNPVPRYVTASSVTALRGKFGQGFDVRGPAATLCGECGELLMVDQAGKLNLMIQRHLWSSHAVDAPLMETAVNR